MILKRFIAVFFEHAQFEETTRITIIDHAEAKDHFLTKGKILIEPGWLKVYGRNKGVAENKGELSPINDNESAKVEDTELLKKKHSHLLDIQNQPYYRLWKVQEKV